MRGYFEDKRTHPWHRIVADLEKYSPKGNDDELEQTMMLLRSGGFGALGILSLVVALDTPISDILDVFTSQSNWSAGRREVRSLCSNMLQEMIKKGELRHLLPSALERDGFGYLVEPLEDAKWEEFTNAKPSVKRGYLNLEELEKSIIGSKFLAEEGVFELKISKEDERVPRLIEAYEHYLIEYEIDRKSKLPITSETEQVTLNGSPIEREAKTRDRKADTNSSEDAITQHELTDFIEKIPVTDASKPEKKTKTRRGK